jgi:phosphatidylserine/phosphatidylglycerophosphate/cardiolipin synthase-like enzyme
LHNKGVLLYACADLHAKILLLDDVAIIGSGNMSSSSENRMVEAALISDHASVVDRRSAVLLKPFRPRTSHIVKLRSITVVHYDAYDFSAKGENRHPPTPPTSHTEDKL